MVRIAIAIILAFTASQTFATTQWTEKTQTKYHKLINMGFDKEIAYGLIDECKNSARSPVKCIKIGASILGAESGRGKHCNYNGCFGILGKKYATKREGVNDWVKKYNRWWYTAKDGSFFYGKDGKPGRSMYCRSEESSGTQGWCPNGKKSFDYIYSKIDFAH